MKNYLVISDLHCPYHHPDAFDFLNDLRKFYKPDHVVCIGDEIDAYAFSRFDKDPEMSGPSDELNKAIEALKKLYALFPKVYVCESNHTVRPWAKAKSAGLPSRMLRNYKDVLQAPDGWIWGDTHVFENDVWIPPPGGGKQRGNPGKDAVVFMHGTGCTGKSALTETASSNRAHTVLGHTHTFPGLVYSGNRFGAVWCLNVGCLIDVNSPAFNYVKKNKNFPVVGTGVLVEGRPIFIPLEKQNSNPSN